MNEEQTCVRQQVVVRQRRSYLCRARVLWLHVIQVDIPEEQGNVVVLYEVC